MSQNCLNVKELSRKFLLGKPSVPCFNFGATSVICWLPLAFCCPFKGFFCLLGHLNIFISDWWHSQKLVLIELSNKAWVEVPQSIGENIMEYCSAWAVPTLKPEPPVRPELVEIQTAAVSCCLCSHVCLRYFVWMVHQHLLKVHKRLPVVLGIPVGY